MAPRSENAAPLLPGSGAQLRPAALLAEGTTRPRDLSGDPVEI